MSLLDLLADRETWEQFYAYKTSLALPVDYAARLRAFIDDEGYLAVCRTIRDGSAFPLPRKSIISKLSSGKKRTVYTYPDAENMVLKLLTYLLLRRYDGIFDPGLYSFRPGRTAKDAVRRLLRTPGLDRKYFYKADIHDYFNSVPIDRLLPMLTEVLADDPELYAFLAGLLSEPQVLDHGRPVTENKGIMAGTPLASFYANLYLRGLDHRFALSGIPYARYSDDIILFADTPAQAEEYAAGIREYLREAGLTINPDKESGGAAADGWVFLGFRCGNDVVDIAPATVSKLKAKMRRKARALRRWQLRNGLPAEKAATAFIRIFNRKLLESPVNHDLTWSYWFFSMINTTESLRQIDHYSQECLRYLLSGVRTKARYNVRYTDLKRLGYRSLVHAYYTFEAENS